MSYDLAVFDPDAAPRTRVDFLKWYREQTEWAEDHTYDNPDVCTPQLRAWFFDMITAYPAMNGPFARRDFDGPTLTDYCVGSLLIYVAFRWSEADIAYETTFHWANRHLLGFFDVSSEEGDVWLPDSNGDYVWAHSGYPNTDGQSRA